ncbi:ATP-binding protein [Flavobacterium sp.]|uniref:tetratricopeptide repeat-containing sensor histidine kinase n=1 Tax=Flavobacterium sp. TaxID=239 RepID=UPI0028BEF6C8|nr:ATP-binding protein [Flavobacterium sp.]
MNKKFNKNEINLRVAHNKACILFYEKNFSQCEVNEVGIVKEAIKKNDLRLVYDCYLILGMASRGMQNYETAIDYYNKAYFQAEKLKNYPQYKLLKAQPLNYIALVLQKQHKYRDAIVYSEKALSQDDFKTNDPVSYVYFTNALAYSKFKNNDKSCLDIFKSSLKIGDSLENFHMTLTSKLYLSEYYFHYKNNSLAKKYAIEAYEASHTNKICEDELKALELLADIDTTKSTYYREKYIALSDSLQNVERATRNKFARIEFETDEITTEKKLVEAEKERISAQRWLFLGTGLFSVIALILLYIVKAQRTKNKELQYLQEQQQANEEIYKLMLGQQQKLEEGKQFEKKRISRELHDGIMGKLTAIRLNLFVLQKRDDPETIAKCVTHVNEIQEIEKEIRKIAHDLNNNMFSNQSDFTVMVDNLVENIKEHSTIDFQIFTDESIDWLSVNNNVKMQVYRILQESLQNIEKYAQAQKVSISMLKEDNSLAIKVTDDGIGFSGKTKGGIGLKNMKERALEIGGILKVKSEPGKGTQISLIIPT